MAFYQTSAPDAVYLPPPPPHLTKTPEVHKIRDWLPWSIINIFLSWGFGGIVPLIFTILCRNYKRNNNLSDARTMSTLALVFNIIATLGGIAGWISLIVLLVIRRRLYGY